MNPSRIAAPLSLLFTLPGLAKTQTQAQLIADLNKAPNLSQGSIPSPRILTKIGKSFLISAWSQDAGVELFRSQGTPQTTRLVQDIYPGPSSSSPHYLGRLGKLVYLIADDPVHGRELWVSDGTSLGTRFFKDLVPGSGGLNKNASIASIAISGKLFFLFEAPGSSFQLWISDGSTKGTQKIREWKVPPSRGGEIDVQNLGSKLFFSFPDKPRQAWISDGTSAGTHLLLPKGQLGLTLSYPKGSVLFGGQVLFLAWDIKGNLGLYSSDGTAKGTRLRVPIGKVRLFSSSLLALKSHLFLNLYFLQGSSVNSLHNLLLSFDRQFRPGLAMDLWNKLELLPLMEFQSKALLTFYTKQKTFFSVLSDGSPQGTRILIPSHNRFTDPTRIFLTYQRGLFFTEGPSPKIHAWDPNLQRFESIPIGRFQGDFIQDQNRVLFSALDLSFGANTQLRALWETDGSKQGTRQWKFGKGFFPTLGSNGIAIIPGQDDRVLLLTPTPPQGAGLYEFRGFGLNFRSLGQAPGIPKVTNPWSFQTRFGPTFFGGNTNGGAPVGVTDGTLKGTRILPKIFSSVTETGTKAVEMGDRLIFGAKSIGTQSNMVLYISDGTHQGTKPLLDKNFPLPPLEPYAFQCFGNRIAFFARNVKGLSAYISDGSSKGTTPMNHYPLPLKTTKSLKGFTFWGGQLLFHYTSNTPPNRRYYLLAMDPRGTTTILHQETIRSIEQLYRIGNTLYALRRSSSKQTRLDYVQGPGALFFPIQTFGQYDSPQLFNIQERLYAFIPANLRTKSFEIWANNGGITSLKRVYKAPLPPLGPTDAKFLFSLGTNKLLLQINKPSQGWEPAILNLRTKTLHSLGDIYPGPKSSKASSFRYSRGRLLFFATDPSHGREPWFWPTGPCGKPIGAGCSQTPLRTPTLQLTDPILGTQLRAWGQDSPSNSWIGLLLIGHGALNGPYLPGGSTQPCRLHVDLSRSWLLAGLFTPNNTQPWSWTRPIPNAPSLLGLTITWQVVFPERTGGFALSNGYEVTFGK